MDTDAEPGDINIGGYGAKDSCANKGKKKCDGYGENYVKVKTGFMMNNPPPDRTFHF